jgi:hypothetical protein
MPAGRLTFSQVTKHPAFVSCNKQNYIIHEFQTASFCRLFSYSKSATTSQPSHRCQSRRDEYFQRRIRGGHSHSFLCSPRNTLFSSFWIMCAARNDIYHPALLFVSMQQNDDVVGACVKCHICIICKHTHTSQIWKLKPAAKGLRATFVHTVDHKFSCSLLWQPAVDFILNKHVTARAA